MDVRARDYIVLELAISPCASAVGLLELLLLLRPLLIMLLGFDLIILLLIWLLLESSLQTLNYSIGQLAMSQAHTSTTHALTWVLPLASGLHWARSS